MGWQIHLVTKFPLNFLIFWYNTLNFNSDQRYSNLPSHINEATFICLADTHVRREDSKFPALQVKGDDLEISFLTDLPAFILPLLFQLP